MTPIEESKQHKPAKEIVEICICNYILPIFAIGFGYLNSYVFQNWLLAPVCLSAHIMTILYFVTILLNDVYRVKNKKEFPYTYFILTFLTISLYSDLKDMAGLLQAPETVKLIVYIMSLLIMVVSQIAIWVSYYKIMCKASMVDSNKPEVTQKEQGNT